MDAVTYALLKKLIVRKQIKDIKVDDNGNLIVVSNDGTEIVVGNISSWLCWTDIY